MNLIKFTLQMQAVFSFFCNDAVKCLTVSRSRVANIQLDSRRIYMLWRKEI